MKPGQPRRRGRRKRTSKTSYQYNQWCNGLISSQGQYDLPVYPSVWSLSIYSNYRVLHRRSTQYPRCVRSERTRRPGTEPRWPRLQHMRPRICIYYEPLPVVSLCCRGRSLTASNEVTSRATARDPKERRLSVRRYRNLNIDPPFPVTIQLARCTRLRTYYGGAVSPSPRMYVVDAPKQFSQCPLVLPRTVEHTVHCF